MSEEGSGPDDAARVGRRGFIGAGLATAGAALAAPAGAALVAPLDATAATRGPASRRATVPLGTSTAPPDAFSLVEIPAGRIAAAVRRLPTIIREVMARTGVPGLAAAVVRGDRLLYADGFGVRDVTTGARVDAATVFHLASVSKSLSATVVAGAVRPSSATGPGRLRWSDPVAAQLPWFKLADPYVTEQVTVADLFSHRSGLPGHAGDLLEDLGYDQRYILGALALEPLHPFRITYEYTNFGLTAAAEAVAAASGRSWATLAERTLFRPLGMTATSFRDADFLRRRNRAAMHVRIGGRWVQRYTRDADAEAPAGGASANVLDLARWMSLLLAGGRWRGRRVIDAASLAEAHVAQMISGTGMTPTSRGSFYGFGTNVSYDYSGRLRLGHSGGFAQGAATVYSLLPSERLGIVVLTNGSPYGIPESIAAYFLDLVVAGRIVEDWLALYAVPFDAMYVNHSVLAGKRPPRRPVPARPGSFYAGTYRNDYYGPLEIRSAGGGLRLLIGPRPEDYPLTHWTGDRFAFHPTGENAVGISQATFTGAGGRAASVTLEYYDGNGLGTFVRA